MSYESVNTLPKDTKLTQVKQIIAWLDFMPVKEIIKELKAIKDYQAYFWYDNILNTSYVGVELDISRNKSNLLEVHTRTRIGGSYYDEMKQIEVIKTLQAYFGGKYKTDFGTLIKPKCSPPKPIETSLYNARWRLHNNLMKARVANDYKIQKTMAMDRTGISWMDDLNPDFYSNCFVIPYIIGVWESYFRDCFSAVIQFGKQDKLREIYKNANINGDDFVEIITNPNTYGNVIAEQYSFQDPQKIITNFSKIDIKLDKAFYNGKKNDYYKQIRELVQMRHSIVHEGQTFSHLMKDDITKIINIFEKVAELTYQCFAKEFSFKPTTEFQIYYKRKK